MYLNDLLVVELAPNKFKFCVKHGGRQQDIFRCGFDGTLMAVGIGAVSFGVCLCVLLYCYLFFCRHSNLREECGGGWQVKKRWNADCNVAAHRWCARAAWG